jgi:hypothetical protein
MAISELLKIVPPPAAPVENKNGGVWQRAQKALGTNLPGDYRELGLRYGSGKFCGYLGVINPLSTTFDSSVKYLLDTLRQMQRRRNYPYAVFPEQPGLLPWGGDENGHMLHWLTEGLPDAWPVIIESHEGELERFHMAMTTFLAKALTNELRPTHIWNTPFTKEELVFTPAPRKVRKRG